MMRRHAELLAQHLGEERGCIEFRKHVSWYLKGFAAGGELRRSLAMISSLAELDELLARLDPAEPFPVSELGAPRGRQGSPRDKVALPEHWLEDTDGTGYGSPRRPRRPPAGEIRVTRLLTRQRNSTLSGAFRRDRGHADRVSGIGWPCPDVVDS